LKISNFFKGHERSVKAKKNIIASFGIKGISIIVGFLMVRVVLDYLDQTKYGIWLTLTSLLTWFSFFEIGLDRTFLGLFCFIATTSQKNGLGDHQKCEDQFFHLK